MSTVTTETTGPSTEPSIDPSTDPFTAEAYAERLFHAVVAAQEVQAAYLGDHMEYTVATALGELFVVDRAVARPVPVGSPVWLELADHGVTVVPA